MKHKAFTQHHFGSNSASLPVDVLGSKIPSNKKHRFNQSGAGFSLTETLIIGAVFGLFVLVGTLLLSNERARVRDAKRIADMTRLSAGFALLYAQKASYADAATGCATVGTDAAACALSDVAAGLTAVKDPSRFSYVVVRVPDSSDFAVQFHLERNYGTLLAGTHTLTKTGIH